MRAIILRMLEPRTFSARFAFVAPLLVTLGALGAACGDSASSGGNGGKGGGSSGTESTSTSSSTESSTASSTASQGTASTGSSTTNSTGSSTASGGLSTASGCAVFLADSAWYEDVSQAETTTDYALPNAKLHPDFDTDPGDGIPYNYVNNSTQKSNVSFDEDDESDKGPYPIPANPLIEGGGAGSGDAHLLLIQTDECVLYELDAASFSNGKWSAYSGAIWDLKVNSTRPTCFTSADAAGLPIFPGLIRYEEVKAGAINHAIRFTMDKVQAAFIAPASHWGGGNTNTSDPPFGLRVRLKGDFNISKAPPQAKIILTAMQKYGLILADIGSNWYIGGSSDPNWDFDNDVTYLEQISGSDFEVIKPGPITAKASGGCP